LSRFTRRIVLAYDADEAGQSAAERVYAWERTHEVGFWVVDLPSGTDPDDLARNEPDRLAELVAGARPFLEFRVARVLRSADLSSVEGRARAAESALAVVAEHPDDLVVDQYLMNLAQECRIDVDRLRERLPTVRRELRRQPEPSRRRTQDGEPADDGAAPPTVPDLEPIPEGAEREALRLLVHERELAEPYLEPALFVHPTARVAFEVLARAPGVAEAIAGAPTVVAEELRKLSVEDLAVDATGILARLGSEAGRRELVDLELEARSSDDPLEYSDAIAYLKVTIDELRRPRVEVEVVATLLQWLCQRHSAP